MLSGENVAIPFPFVVIDSQSDLDIPIARRKRKKIYILHPLHNFLPYAHLFTQYCGFVFSIDSHPIFKSVLDAMSNLG